MSWCYNIPIWIRLSGLWNPALVLLEVPRWFCNWKWGPATHCSKAIKEGRLVGRKVCFISVLPATGGGGEIRLVSKGWLPSTDNQGVRTFISRGRGYRQRQHTQLWQSSWNWSCGGLISIFLIVLSTINLQFQGRFVPISLRPVLRIVAAYVMATVWSSCS